MQRRHEEAFSLITTSNCRGGRYGSPPTSSIHVTRFDGRADSFCLFSVLEIVRPRGSIGLELPEVVP